MPDNQKFSENPNTFLCRGWSHSALAWASLEKGRGIEWSKNVPSLSYYRSAVNSSCSREPANASAVFMTILGLFALFWSAFTCFHLFWLAFTCFHLFWLAFTYSEWRQFVCACSVDLAAKWVRMLDGSRAFEKRVVIPAWTNFGEERAEHRSTLFGTDIDVIQPDNYWDTCSSPVVKCLCFFAVFFFFTGIPAVILERIDSRTLESLECLVC